MDLHALILALGWIAVLCIIVGAITALAPQIPKPAITVLWAIVAIIAVVLLVRAFLGTSTGLPSL